MKNTDKYILILLFQLLFPLVYGQESGKPVLNQHVFTPISDTRDPFTPSKITMQVGIGQTADFNFPNIIIGNDTIGGLDGELLFINLGLSFQQRIRDWMAFYARVFVASRSGTDVNSIFQEGINSVISFELGSKIKLVRNDKIMLSVSYEVQSYEANFLDIKGFITDVVNGVDNPQITQNVPVLTVGTGLHFAWGITPSLGFLSEINYSYGETYNRAINDSRYSFNSTIDLNLYPKFKIPLGATVSYTSTTEPEIVYVENQSAQTISLKLSYTGRENMDFGIKAGRATLPLSSVDRKPNVSTILMSMSYFF